MTSTPVLFIWEFSRDLYPLFLQPRSKAISSSLINLVPTVSHLPSGWARRRETLGTRCCFIKEKREEETPYTGPS